MPLNMKPKIKLLHCIFYKPNTKLILSYQLKKAQRHILLGSLPHAYLASDLLIPLTPSFNSLAF